MNAGMWKKFRFSSFVSKHPAAHPPSISTLLEDPMSVFDRYPQGWGQASQWRHSRSGNSEEDDSLSSLQRLYEFFICNATLGLRNELEYFYGQYTWPVESILDPRDPDPVRYACLAALTHILCKALNSKIENGIPRDAGPCIDPDEEAMKPKVLENPPKWALGLPRVTENGGYYKIPSGKGWPEDSSEFLSEDFKRYGILAFEPDWRFV